jgi:hypothetical protein
VSLFVDVVFSGTIFSQVLGAGRLRQLDAPTSSSNQLLTHTMAKYCHRKRLFCHRPIFFAVLCPDATHTARLFACAFVGRRFSHYEAARTTTATKDEHDVERRAHDHAL